MNSDRLDWTFIFKWKLTSPSIFTYIINGLHHSGLIHSEFLSFGVKIVLCLIHFEHRPFEFGVSFCILLLWVHIIFSYDHLKFWSFWVTCLDHFGFKLIWVWDCWLFIIKLNKIYFKFKLIGLNLWVQIKVDKFRVISIGKSMPNCFLRYYYWPFSCLEVLVCHHR